MVADRLLDGYDLARSQGQREGEIPFSDFGQLVGLLEDTPGVLRWQIRGSYDMGMFLLTLDVEGQVNLMCQRCLQPYKLPVATQAHFRLVNAQAAQALAPNGVLLVAHEDEYELLENGDAIDVAHLVEEELILALPMVPRHHDGGCVAVEAQVTSRTSPFDVLAALKQKSE